MLSNVKQPTVKLLVTIETKGQKPKEVENYVREAIQCWMGCKHPDDPIFDLVASTMRVKRIIKGVKRRDKKAYSHKE